MTRNNGKTAVRILQRPFIVSFVSLILLAVQPVLAEDGGPLLPAQPGSAGDGTLQWLQPNKTTAPLNQTPRDVIDVRITDNLSCIQQRLSEINGSPITPEDAAAWAGGQAGHSLARRDYHVTGGEQRGAQLIKKSSEELEKSKSVQKMQKFSFKRLSDGTVMVQDDQFKALSTENSLKIIKPDIDKIGLDSEGKVKLHTKIGISASGSATGFNAKTTTHVIDKTGSTVVTDSTELVGPKAEAKLTAEFNGENIEAAVNVGVSALSLTATTGIGVIKDNSIRSISAEGGVDLGVGASAKIKDGEVSEKVSFAGISQGLKYKKEKLPDMDNYSTQQTLHDVGYTPESLEHLPNRSEPSQLNTIIADCERAKDETRGDETVIARDPDKDTGARQATETPIPANGSGILDTSNSRSSMAGNNSDAPENNDKRQSMKDEFNRNKQQNQQAVANRQAEQAAKAAEAQNSAQQQDFFSTLNNAIAAGSAAARASSTAGSSGAVSQSSGFQQKPPTTGSSVCTPMIDLCHCGCACSCPK